MTDWVQHGRRYLNIGLNSDRDAEALIIIAGLIDEIERLQGASDQFNAELTELWHFATCPFDHCERCCAKEGVIKGIRDRLTTIERWADAALVWRKTHPEQE